MLSLAGIFFFTEFFTEMQSDVMMLRNIQRYFSYVQKELVEIRHAGEDMCAPLRIWIV